MGVFIITYNRPVTIAASCEYIREMVRTVGRHSQFWVDQWLYKPTNTMKFLVVCLIVALMFACSVEAGKWLCLLFLASVICVYHHCLVYGLLRRNFKCACLKYQLQGIVYFSLMLRITHCLSDFHTNNLVHNFDFNISTLTLHLWNNNNSLIRAICSLSESQDVDRISYTYV